jgi:hypothetical protein
MSAEKLYTPKVLALATGLAAWPLSGDLPVQASARSKSCGSTLTLGLSTGADGRIARVGLRAQACAIGQADVGEARDRIANWLAGSAPMPDWPGLDSIAAAQGLPARHGAILLAWNAASEALCAEPEPR